MPTNPLLWCEARCAGVHDPEHPGCLETSVGEFGATAAERAARAQGWIPRARDWFCPACAKRLGIRGRGAPVLRKPPR